jgi:uncharacterized protein YigE (DUF2233 family)
VPRRSIHVGFVATAAVAGGLAVALLHRREDAAPSPASASARSSIDCSQAVVAGAKFRVCTFAPAEVDLRLYWKDDAGEQIGDLARLGRVVQGEGRELLLAMNAGMYGADADSTPVGLYIEHARELVPLNLRDSAGGSFYYKPNGVFYVANGHAGIVDAREFAQRAVHADIATQSGPLLVTHDSFPHADYGPNGPRLAPRNAVGVRSDGRVVFVLAETPVNMHELRVALRDRFGCVDALYLDGAISELLVPPEAPSKRRYGAILAVVAR